MQSSSKRKVGRPKQQLCKWETEFEAYLGERLASIYAPATLRKFLSYAGKLVRRTTTRLAARYPTSKNQLISMQAEMG